MEICCEPIAAIHLMFLRIKQWSSFYPAAKKLMVSCVYNTIEHTVDELEYKRGFNHLKGTQM